MPLLYSYSPFVEQIESYEPKTVQQFSAFVPDGQVRVADEGRKGMEVDVHRTISYEGSVVVDEMISSDFYAPLPKIELHPLKKDSQQTSGKIAMKEQSIHRTIKILLILQDGLESNVRIGSFTIKRQKTRKKFSMIKVEM